MGGRVEPVKAYSRNRNSCSQELMNRLVMNGAPMLDLPNSMQPSMGAPIDAVVRDETAIAFSVFFYEQFMNRDERNKLIGIDGIVPTSDTIASGAYPLTTEVYVVIREDTPSGNPA